MINTALRKPAASTEPRRRGRLASVFLPPLLVTMLVSHLVSNKVFAQDATPEDSPAAETTANGKQTDNANQATSKKSEPRPSIDTEKNTLELLTQEIDGSEQVWLEAQGEKFLALWQKDRTGNPFGAVLILHGDGQSVDEPYEISALRKSLIHHGWATLSVNLPQTKSPTIPPRPDPTPSASPTPETNTSENKDSENASEQDEVEDMAEAIEKEVAQGSEELDTPSPKKDPESLSKSRLEAAIKHLNNQGQYNIVIVGHGVAATRAMKFISTITTGNNVGRVKGSGVIQRPIRAIVWVAARNRVPESQDQIQDFIKDPDLPILDIYYGEHYLDVIETKQRYRSIREQSVDHYYQVKLMRPLDSDEDYENRLTRRVRGFLNKHAKGVEVGR